MSILLHPMFPIVILFILFFMNVPIALSLIGSSLYYFAFINKSLPLDMSIQPVISTMQQFNYLAVPFFIMLGSVMNYSGLSEKLMDFADVLAGHMKGGLAQVNCLLSAFMGGITGSANADAAMESKILVPEMIKKGMPKDFSAAVTAASSSVSPVIPPGNNLIIYAMMVVQIDVVLGSLRESVTLNVSDMFLAGYTPGIVMTLAMMVTVYIIANKRNYAKSRDHFPGFGMIFRQFFRSIWALCIPFVIILGMRIGWCTPTEAGAIASVFSFVVGIIAYKRIKLKHIPLIMKETVQSTGSVMLIIAAAKLFGHYMTTERLPEMITQALMAMTSNKFLLLMVINFLLLFVGMFIEGGAALVILGPLLIQPVARLGVDPLHFGVVLIINIMIGGLTPPFGSMMFTVCSIVGCKFQDFVREVWPFIVALLLVLVAMTYSEDFALAIPKFFGYKTLSDKAKELQKQGKLDANGKETSFIINKAKDNIYTVTLNRSAV